MSAWAYAPRALRRKLIKIQIKANPASVRQELARLKEAREDAAKTLKLMDEAIEDTEALFGELKA